MTTRLTLTFWDRVRVLFGVPLYVRFHAADGDCNAACSFSGVVQRDWPENSGHILGGWPPMPRALPPPPNPPPPPKRAA